MRSGYGTHWAFVGMAFLCSMIEENNALNDIREIGLMTRDDDDLTSVNYYVLFHLDIKMNFR